MFHHSTLGIIPDYFHLSNIKSENLENFFNKNLNTPKGIRTPMAELRIQNPKPLDDRSL